MVPRSFFLSGVTLQEQYAVASGGYRDIFRGFYQDQPVAVKRLRTYSNQVSEFDKGVCVYACLLLRS